ncbi:hypothetical protein H2248_009445 [Termitomyces sp. 'cryptogamus']|nr:hypothetical protein H2248_009445 [Termitomyces sp. 'cryptogamus']
MGASDKAVGVAMLLAAAVVFTYYTTWALLLDSPFSTPPVKYTSSSRHANGR